MKTYRSEWFLAPANDYSEYWTSTQIIYWRGSSLPGEGSAVANSEEEAEREIDDKIILEQEHQLRIASQCIEACREEFMYRLNKVAHPAEANASACLYEAHHSTEEIVTPKDRIAEAMIKLCTTALSNLPAFDVSAEAKNIDEVLKKISE
jgi:hypothetical protein